MRLLKRPVSVLLAMVFVLAACTSTPSETAETTDPIESTVVGGDIEATGEIPAPTDPNPDPTPIALDDAVTTGVLANGLTYYIIENQSPGQRAEIRLAVNAGSAQQPVADAGSAHFLEHMLFNGTDAYPGNELDNLLRGLGMEIGPDINAYTSFDETVYELSLPDATTATIDQGLKIVAEWAGAATIDPAEVLAERGVVREEHRLRSESADGVLNERFTEVYTAESGYEGADPIGSEDMILATETEALRSFYDDWYRPDNMAVIIAGDFQAGAVETQVESALSGLEARGSNEARTPTVAGPITTPVVEVLTHPDGPEPSLSLDFQLPTWEPGTVGGERLLLADEVVAIMVQNYLDEAAANGSLALVRPYVGTFEVARERRFLGMNIAGDDLALAATELFRGLNALQVDGFTEDHLGQAKQQIQSGIDQVKAGASTRQDADRANGLVAYYLAGHAFEPVDVWYARLTAELESFTTAELNNLFRWEMAASVPLLVAIGSDEGSLPTKAELEAAVDGAADSAAVEMGDVPMIETLMEQPEAIAPTGTGAVAGSDGATWWTFANGTTVLHEFSTIESGSVMMWAIGEGGRVLLSPEDAAVADVALTTVGRSGIGEYPQVSLARYLADNSVSLAPFISTESEGFTGQAESNDVASLFELLATYVTAPRADQTGLAEAKDSAKSQIRQIETNPNYASSLAALDARFGADSRYIGVPTTAEVDAMTTDDALRIYNERFGGVDDLVVIVVGDVPADEIEGLATTYIASLPARDDGAVPDMPPLPAGPVERSVDAGTNASGAGLDLSYSMLGGLTKREQVAGDFLTSIINGRLFDRIREELGASYGGGSASISTGQLEGSETSLAVSVDGDPDRLDEIRAAVFAELNSLATNGPSATDFADAKSIVASDADLVSNFDILLSLSDWALDRESPAYTRYDYATDAGKVTAADVQALASKLVVDENLVIVTREPSE